MFVGKSYVSNGLDYPNSEMTIRPKINKNKISFTYMLDSYYLQYSRLGHINYDTLSRLINIQSIYIYIYSKLTQNTNIRFVLRQIDKVVFSTC